MKFNMGSGRRKLPGYVNVDAAPESEPDEVWDLEQTPWPWPDNCADEVRFIHSLEHMGGDPKVFLAMMVELYRICAPGAEVVIRVPHPRHDNFVSDPTHVRAITPMTFHLFDQTLNQKGADIDAANSPLGVYLGIDFETVKAESALDEPYWSQFQRGELTMDDLNLKMATLANVVKEYRITLRARKP